MRRTRNTLALDPSSHPQPGAGSPEVGKIACKIKVIDTSELLLLRRCRRGAAVGKIFAHMYPSRAKKTDGGTQHGQTQNRAIAGTAFDRQNGTTGKNCSSAPTGTAFGLTGKGNACAARPHDSDLIPLLSLWTGRQRTARVGVTCGGYLIWTGGLQRESARILRPPSSTPAQRSLARAVVATATPWDAALPLCQDRTGRPLRCGRARARRNIPVAPLGLKATG